MSIEERNIQRILIYIGESMVLFASKMWKKKEASKLVPLFWAYI